MKIMGLDLSLTAPGVAYDAVAETLPRPATKGTVRLAHWRDKFNRLLDVVQPTVVVMEGYSFGSMGQSVVQIGELGGVIRLAIFDHDASLVEVPPTKLKKYATGKGNASKEAVTIEAVHRSGRRFSDNNAADAWWLYQMGLTHYFPDHSDAVKLPLANRSAMIGILWPQAVSA